MVGLTGVETRFHQRWILAVLWVHSGRLRSLLRGSVASEWRGLDAGMASLFIAAAAQANCRLWVRHGIGVGWSKTLGGLQFPGFLG